MTGFNKWRSLGAGAVLAAMVALSGCATPPPPPPPPPKVVVVPPKPYPPLGAPDNMTTPPVDANGVRQTINTGLSEAQTTWTLRSAYNVAALNCTKPEHAGILAGYRDYLKAQDKKLSAVNKTLDKEYRERAGSSYIKTREAYMTQVYNYFALPPTLPLFCDAVLTMSQDLKTVKSADLDSASAVNLSRLDQVFKDFYTGYDQYKADLAAWQARYYPSQANISAAPGIALPVAGRAQAE